MAKDKKAKVEKEATPSFEEKMMQMMEGVVKTVTEQGARIDKLEPKTAWLKQAEKKEPEFPKDVEPGTDVLVPPKWRKIVSEVLGEDFGLEVEYPDNGRGFSFSIIVPADKSNASKEHWDMHKTDRRSRVLLNGEGTEAIRAYCELIKRNLTAKK